jgi:acyl-coenzyme A thioesterase PaaI-like protein
MMMRHGRQSLSDTRSQLLHSTATGAARTVESTAWTQNTSFNASDGAVSEQQNHIEQLISSLPLVRYLRSSSSSLPSKGETHPAQFKEFALHSNKSRDTFSKHLVAGSLFGKNKLPVYPRLFIREEPTPRVIAAVYIGSHVCGHPGYVHGGLPFLLFDDIFAFSAGMAFTSGVAMTANMNINFRRPCPPDRLYIIRAEVVRREGRKAWLEGEMRSLEPFSVEEMQSRDVAADFDVGAEEASATLVAEASSVFVEPKFAHVGQLDASVGCVTSRICG